VFWTKKNLKHLEYERDGALVCSQEPSKFKSGHSYTGGWVRNKKHGFGTQVWENGNKYEGDWVNGMRDGTGTLWIKKKGKLVKEYSGEWKANKRHGEGVHYGTDGSKYEGQWSTGKKYGRGTLKYTNGDVYEGEFLNDKRSGLGVLYLENGDCYQGHFLHDDKSGPGRYCYASSKKIYQGEWSEGTPKCGEYFDWDTGDTKTFELPSLQLENSESVLEESCKAVRRLRADRKKTESNLELEMKTEVSGFSTEELEDIYAAFQEIDIEQKGTIFGNQVILVLNELGIFPLEDDMKFLLHELNANESSEISAHRLIDILTSLRE